MKPEWDVAEWQVAIASGLVIGAGWVFSGNEGHPLLLAAVGFVVGSLFGLRSVWAFRTAGPWGRRYIIICAGLIALGVAAVALRSLTGWW